MHQDHIHGAVTAFGEVWDNAIKHGTGTSVRVKVENHPETLEIKVVNQMPKAVRLNADTCRRIAEKERELEAKAGFPVSVDAAERKTTPEETEKAKELLRRVFPNESEVGGFGTGIINGLAHCYELKSRGKLAFARLVWEKKRLEGK